MHQINFDFGYSELDKSSRRTPRLLLAGS